MRNEFATTESKCISGYVKIGGMRAHVLVDTGSEVQLMAARFATATGIKIRCLKTPVGLRLATAGHNSSIRFGCEAEMKVGEKKIHTYWDIERLDHYDAIPGIQALRSLDCIAYTGQNHIELPDGTPLIADRDLIHPSKPSALVKQEIREVGATSRVGRVTGKTKNHSRNGALVKIDSPSELSRVSTTAVREDQ